MTLEDGDVLLMMLLETLGFESCGGREALFDGIMVGTTTAADVRHENRVRLTKAVRLILLSRCLSLMRIKDTHVRGVAIIKDPTFRLYGCVLLFKRSDLRHASSDLMRD